VSRSGSPAVMCGMNAVCMYTGKAMFNTDRSSRCVDAHAADYVDVPCPAP
jgi:hypothetical protein